MDALSCFIRATSYPSSQVVLTLLSCVSNDRASVISEAAFSSLLEQLERRLGSCTLVRCCETTQGGVIL